ncbi:LamG-like jellyroll fold domain-containing protein [Sorangium sp. So ce1389]|uniref:LamG-like jellyroll fold domain-containing protein n=1 Tax=Sorangium sp. So ce1389 TaxID=3133336 RepID=UPI003F61D4A7
MRSRASGGAARASILLLAATAWSGCAFDGGELEEDETLESSLAAVDCGTDFVCALRQTNVGQPFNPWSVPVENFGQLCTYQPASGWTAGDTSFRNTYGELVNAAVGAGGLFPGALHRGRRMATGRLDAQLWDDQTNGGLITLSGVKLADGSSTQKMAARYTKGEVQDTIQAILRDGQAQFAPSTLIEWSDVQKTSEKALTWKLSFDWVTKALGLTVGTDGKTVVKQATTDLLLRVSQDFFHASVQSPNPDTFFNGVTVQQLNDAGISINNPLTYLSRVTYGRLIYARLHSSHQESSVRAALTAAVTYAKQQQQQQPSQLNPNSVGNPSTSLSSGPQVKLDAGLGLTYEQKKTLDETTLTLWEVGGGTSLPITATAFLEGLLNGTALTNGNVNPQPIAYSMDHFLSRQNLRYSMSTDFHDERCEPVGRHNLVIRFSSLFVNENGDGDDLSDVRAWARVFDAKTGALLMSGGDAKKRVGDRHTFVYGGELPLYDQPLSENPSYQIVVDAEEQDGLAWKQVSAGSSQWRWNGVSDLVSNNTPGSAAFTALSGLWSNAQNQVANPGEALTVETGAGINTNLNVRLNYTVSRNDQGRCPAGYKWSGIGCTQPALLLNDAPPLFKLSGGGLGSKTVDTCVGDDLVINNNALYYVADKLQAYKDTFSMNITELDASTLTPTGALSRSQSFVMRQEPSFAAPGAFSVRGWLTSLSATLAMQAGRVYKFTSDKAVGEYFARVLPIGTSFTVDENAGSTQGTATVISLPATSPLTLDAGAVCSNDKDYTVEVYSSAGQRLLSRSLSRALDRKVDLRGLLTSLGPIAPGTQYDVRLTSGASATQKTLMLESCPVATSWDGLACRPAQVKALQNTPSGMCIQTSQSTLGSAPVPGACSARHTGFVIMDMPNGTVQLKSDAGLCLETSNLGSLRLARCAETPSQQFTAVPQGGFIQLQQGASCLSFGGVTAGQIDLGSCSVSSAANQITIVDPAIHANDYLTAWYSGESYNDQIGTANALPQGNTRLAAGRCGNAYTLDGDYDYLNLTNGASLAPGAGDFTISVWVNTTTSTASIVDGFYNNGVRLSLDSGVPLFRMFAGSATTQLRGTTSVSNGQWHHIIVSVDRDNPVGARLYVDGVLQATADPTAAQAAMGGVGQWTVGTQYYFPAPNRPHILGQIDDLKFFHAALDASTVRAGEVCVP